MALRLVFVGWLVGLFCGCCCCCFEAGSLTESEAYWFRQGLLADEPQGILSLYPPALALQEHSTTPGVLRGSWGSELRFSSLSSQNCLLTEPSLQPLCFASLYIKQTKKNQLWIIRNLEVVGWVGAAEELRLGRTPGKAVSVGRGTPAPTGPLTLLPSPLQKRRPWESVPCR